MAGDMVSKNAFDRVSLPKPVFGKREANSERPFRALSGNVSINL